MGHFKETWKDWAFIAYKLLHVYSFPVRIRQNLMNMPRSFNPGFSAGHDVPHKRLLLICR